MIRPMTPNDNDAVIALAEKLGMFEADDIEHIRITMGSSFEDDSEDLWFVSEDRGLAGVAYCAPEPMTDGTWNVLMLLVDPTRRSQTHGKGLMQHVQQALADNGERLVIVETSSLDDLEGARKFYDKCGYVEEATIRDFYAPGDDKVVFCKSLQAG